MRAAMQHAGLAIDEIAQLKRDPARYLGFVEVHIEQGPVLSELDLPLGVVTSINGSVRFLGEIVGMASHAGTTPMDRRRDAAAALRRARRSSSSVAPARCRTSSARSACCRCRAARSTSSPAAAPSASTCARPPMPQRDALVADVQAELARICIARGLHFSLEETVRAAAAPSAPEWQRRWERAVERLGLPVHRMPSGAGHDAMKLHEVMAQAMLFVRGVERRDQPQPARDRTSNDDIELAVRAFANLLDELAEERAR